ncbi:oxidoreductase [Celerinatantimonas sp. YJH-8]|uniref:oxidoreductase n=1 Tax=Celerinatantimonas sp. YJH-8 TaxID=3228714 RepID=UPI0038C63FDA
MVDLTKAGTYKFAGRQVNRMGYGAMQLSGPGIFGAPEDPNLACEVLKQALAMGVNHIDTSDFYGPYITNQLIKQALFPYPDELTIVTKVGALRDDKANWLPAFEKEQLIRAIHDNCEHLGLEAVDVVNLRAMFAEGPAEGSLEEPLSVLAELQQQGLIKHIGLSNVTPKQLEQAQQMVNIVCVQNMYNVANRQDDDFIDELAKTHIPYVPFFPLGGFSPLQSAVLDEIASQHQVSVMQVALAWLLQRSENILLIPGTSSLAHLQDNLAAAELILPEADIDKLNQIAG